MAISNYAELQTSIAGWLNRTDLDTIIPDFIRLAEERIFDELRARTNEKTVTIAGFIPVDSWVPVPTDLKELKSFTVDGEHLQRLSDQQYLDARSATISTTRYYARIEDRYYLWGDTAGPIDYEIRYWSMQGPLSPTITDTPTLLEYPSLYLYAALKEANGYLMAVDQEGKYDALYVGALNRINQAARRTELAGNTLRAPQRTSGRRIAV